MKQQRENAVIKKLVKLSTLLIVVGVVNACGVEESTQNQPPTVNAGGSYRISADQTTGSDGSSAPSIANFFITAEVSDPDGSIVSYRWEQLSGPTATLYDTQRKSVFGSFIASTEANSIVLRITVVDDDGATSSDDVTVIYGAAASQRIDCISTPGSSDEPGALAVDAGPDLFAAVGDRVDLIAAPVNATAAIVNVSWKRVDGISLGTTLNDATTLNAHFIAEPINTINDTQARVFEVYIRDENNNAAVDCVTVSIDYSASTASANADLSGTITTSSGHTIDSDTNNPNRTAIANDSIATAQHLAMPAIVGGYVNQPGQGATGSSQSAGDVDDYYFITLPDNQIISLSTADTSTTANDLDLYLYSADRVLIDASTSPAGLTENIRINSAGGYFIRVNAASGASSYVLTIEPSSLSTAAIRSWSLQDEFVIGEMIVKFPPPQATASLSAAGNALAQVREKLNTFNKSHAQQLRLKAGQPQRSMLLQFDRTSFSSVVATAGIASTAGPSLQHKLQTLLAIKAFAHTNEVEYISPNYLYRATVVPNDTNYDQQWHYPLINLEQAWDLSLGNTNVVVAVIDSGILPSHPDLAGKLLPGYDFISDDAIANDAEPGIDTDPTDTGDGKGVSLSTFHGTHVAGTIAAATNNSAGVAGVGWNVTVMPLRVLGVGANPGDSVGTEYDLEQALYYAAGLANDSGRILPEPVEVVNLSVARAAFSTTPTPAFIAARNAGVIIVAAAGNRGTNELNAPAAYNGVVSVGAVDRSKALAGYSSFGTTLDVVAPGGGNGELIMSTTANDTVTPMIYNYGGKQGTSMAAPHVAGVVALMKSVYPQLSPDEFDAMLANGQLSDDLGVSGRDDTFGYGLINAEKSVQAAIAAQVATQPLLLAAPLSFDFGVSATAMILTLDNAGAGNLNIDSVNQNSSGWLSITPISVNNNGVGSYRVSVNRTGQGQGLYTATISIGSNGGTNSLPVTMQVVAPAQSENAGYQIIQLIDAGNGDILAQQAALPVAGQYSFSFINVPLGDYQLRSTSDIDNDQRYCEPGEACGMYGDINAPATIVIDGSVKNAIGLDFETGFRSLPLSP